MFKRPEARVMEKPEKEKKGRYMKQVAARDSPIYLQVKANFESCLWYVVEDEDDDANFDIDNDKVIFRSSISLNLTTRDLQIALWS